MRDKVKCQSADLNPAGRREFRQVHSFKVSVPVALSLVILLLVLPAAALAAAANAWDFSNPSDYTYDPSLAEVSGGTAHSKALDLSNGWWTSVYDTGGTDNARGVSCDSSGNPVVAGTVVGTSNDIWVRKYSGTDGSTLWTQVYDSGRDDRGWCVSCDPSGNPVVAGSINNGSNFDVWVRKYSGVDGSTLWTQTYNSNYYDYAYGVSCDSSGNPVVAASVNLGSNANIWVRKYSGTDGSTLWTQTYNSGNTDDAESVSCDPSGDPVVAGYIYNGTTYDIWVRKYSGTDGSTLWTQVYDSGNADYARGVSCDSSGDPVVAGSVNSGGNDNIWVRKYSGTDGSALWTQVYDSGGNDYAYGVSCDLNGDPVVGGYIYNGSTNDISVRKYRGTDGSTLWTQVYDSGGNDYAYGVSCDGFGNPVVSGTVNFDIWVRKYTPGNYALFPGVLTDNAADLTGRDITGFLETVGTGNTGFMTYQLSPDNTTFYYYNGSNWVTTIDDHTKSNTAWDVNAHIAAFNSIATTQLYLRVYLNSNGVAYASLDSVILTMDVYNITAGGSAGGTVSPGSQQVPAGGEAAAIQVNANAGYRITALTDSGESKTVTDPSSMSYPLTNVGTDHDVAVTFATSEPPPTPPTSSTWYLAEGTTAWGFNTYITLLNPNSEEVSAKLTYMDPTPGAGKGKVAERTVMLPPQSQTTVDPRWDLGDTDFSTKVECAGGKQIAVDRTMFWTGEGATSPEGHNSIGVTYPARTWYLPEGSTSWGFETWLLIQNPNSTEATCQVTYMIEGGDPVTIEKKVPAESRMSYNMKDDIGNKDASIKVAADIPVIAERSTYRNNRREGHGSIGTNEPATDYFLAEGAVGYDSGYMTYVIIQNPQNSGNKVTVTYATGTGEVAGPTIDMPANSRKTIRVNDQLPPNTDVSTKVHGEKPIIAERAMYWNSPAGEACHDSIGMDAAHRTFYLPDGQTSEGRETWTLVANPNDSSVKVRISYLMPNGTDSVVFEETIPAKSRRSFNMAEKLPPWPVPVPMLAVANNTSTPHPDRASVIVESVTGGPVIVERAMYWNSRGVGTDTIGGFSD